jgi:hypothetical protein
MTALLADYRAYSLPVPREDAELCFLEEPVPDLRSRAQQQKRPTRSLVFALKPRDRHSPVYYYAACELTQDRDHHRIARPAPPTPSSVVDARTDDTGILPSFGFTREYQSDLLVAIQCEQRGWSDLARALLQRSLKQMPPGGDDGVGIQIVPKPKPDASQDVVNKENARRALARIAWNHWNNALAEPGANRRRIAEHLQTILSTPFGYDTPESKSLLADIARTAEPPHSVPGSIEAQIDRLVDMGPKGFDINGKNSADVDEVNPRYVDLWRLGFAAVPALMGHLDDTRLTRHIQPAIMNAPARQTRISDVVSDILTDLSGGKAGEPEWRGDGRGYGLKRADVEVWWKKARVIGEQKYLLQHALEPISRPGEVIDKKSEYWPNAHMLHLIAWKYPKYLPQLYETMITRYPHAYKHVLTGLLSESNTPEDQKTALLVRGARGGDNQQRLCAFYELLKLRDERTIPLLVERMEKIPNSPVGPYWNSEAGNMAQIARQADDPRAWKALEKLARRSDVQQRMEILQILCYIGTEGKKRWHSIEFMGKFLDDSSERVVHEAQQAGGSRFEGPFAGFTFPRLSVRNLVAMSMAYDLGINAAPDLSWTEKEWSELRKRVQKALAEKQASLGK